MLKHENMRNELRIYLTRTIERGDALSKAAKESYDYKSAWYDQKFAIDFVVEDINIIDDGAPCVGILLYNLEEVQAVQKVGIDFLDFYRIGQSGDYMAAFQSSKWRDVYLSAKAALTLVLLNDTAPPN
jgi:hypothetical protein